MKKTINLEINFNGNGKFNKTGKGQFTGGVKSPKLSDQSIFSVVEVNKKYQIHYKGTKNDYRELAKLFLGLAEIDLKQDKKNFFHHHLDEINEKNVEFIFSKIK